jgi:hypothetical protein
MTEHHRTHCADLAARGRSCHTSEELEAATREQLVLRMHLLATWLGELELGRPVQEEPSNPSSDWSDQDLLVSELRFHNQMALIVNHIHDAYATTRFSALGELYRRFEIPSRQVTAEPYSSLLDTSLAVACAYLASACADAFLIEEAYQLVEDGIALLHAKRARRERLSLPERRDSLAWLRLHLVLAQLKWKGDAGSIERILSPTALVAAFRQHLAYIKDCVQKQAGAPSQQPKELENLLGWFGVNAIKMALRWVPADYRRLIEEFNAHYGPVLAPEAGAFTTAPAPQHHAAWFWDLELFKWYLAGPGTEDEALLCYQWRLDSLRATGSDHYVSCAFVTSAEAELEFLAHQHMDLNQASTY